MLTKVPDITENLAEQVARIVRSIRQLELKKAPSVSETLDWARTLVLLGIENVDADAGDGDRQHPAQVPERHREGGEGVRVRRSVVEAGRTRAVVPDEAGAAGVVDPADPATGAPILSLLAGFIQELREAGLPVSLTENLDAMAAVRAHPARRP